MAGWWRSWHERPYSNGRTWRQHADGTSWGKEGWHGDTSQAWNSAQWTRPSVQWHVSSWWGEDGDEQQVDPPPSPEPAAHDPDQYPWTSQEPHEAHCDPGGLGSDASFALEATHDPPVADGASGPVGDGPSSGASPQVHQGEEEELEGLHAEAIRRFRLGQPSPDSENDEKSCKNGKKNCKKNSKEASSVDEDPIDPEIGAYDPKTGGVLCLICDLPQNSRGQFRDHLKGQKHRKKYERHQKLKADEEAAAAQVALALPLQ